MVLSCPTVIVALFIAELNSTLYQDLPTDVSAIPLENHELVVSGTYPQGSTINSGFNNVHLLHIQGNPYFALNKQSRTLHNKIAIDTIQGDTSFIGVFMMAVNKQNQSQVNFLYCVTYCVGNDTEQLMHEACYDSVSSGALHTTVNGVLLSQHVYESNISRHASVADNVLQLSLTPGNKSNVTFTLLECSSSLFYVDDRGVLRIGRQLVEEDIAIHVLKIAISANISDALQLELALVTVKVIEANTLPPIFEEPDGYTFVVKEGEPGLRVGFVKAVDSDVGLSGKVVYSFGKQQSTSLFELNDASGEIKTAVALDRETAESHLFIVVATDQGVPKPLSSQVEVRVVVEDINDNRPVFMDKEAGLILSAYTQPGPILSLKAEDKDTGENALMTYTISQGNDRKMFGINSTSGELLLVAPLTVTANDKIVLVVSVVDVLSTNSSFQDTAVVKITFRDVTYSGAKSSSVAVISGVSVGGVLFITIIAAVSLLLWKKQKSQLNKRKKYAAIPVINTDRIPFEYERKIYTVGDAVRRSSFEIYPPLKDTARSPGTPRDSQISLDLNTIEYALHQFSLVSNRPGLSHSAPSSPTRELRRSRGSHVSLDLPEMRSQSLSVLPSYISLDMSQVQPGFISKFAQRCLKLGRMESGSHLTSKCSSEYSHTSCGSSGEDMSFESWGSLSTNRHQSFQSMPSIELETYEDVREEDFSTDEHLGRRNLRYAKPHPHVQQISSLQLYEETPHETVSLPIVIGGEENETPEDDQQLPIENLNRSISLPDMAYSSIEGVDQTVRAEISTEAEVESPCLPTLDSTATQSYPKLQPVKSRKARIPVKAKKALQLMMPEKESKQYFQQESSSNDSDDTTQEPNTSIPWKKFPLFDRKKKKSSSRRLQSVSSERRSEVNEPLKAESFISSSSQDSVTSMATQMFMEEASSSPTLPAITDVARTMENTNVVGKQVFHVSQEQDIPYSTNKAGPKDGSGSSSHTDEPSGTMSLSSGNAVVTDSYRAMGESGTTMMLSEGVSDARGNLGTSVSGRSRVILGSTHSSEGSRTSSGGSKGDIDLPREDASFTSIGSSRSLQTDRPQGSQSKLSIELEADQPSSEDYFSTDERPSRRKAIKSITPGTVELCAKFQMSGSFGDNSSSLHQRRSTDDSGKSQSSYTKLQPVKPKKSRVPLKVKKAFKFLTSETEHKEGSSDDSEDTMQEPITPTSRKRFSLFGGKRKKSESHGKTPSHDSLLQKESDILPVPSTQQENAPVVTDQSVITDHFPCSTELETREMRGADTLTEGSIGVASDNGEKLENASAGLSKSSESVIRGEDATIESKEIEEFEREDNIDLSTECAGQSALVMDDSMDAIPEKSCKTEDIEGNEGDLQEQNLRSESVSRESVGEAVEQIEAGSFILSPGQVNLKSSATPSLSQVASFSTRCSKAGITSTSHVPSESSMTDLSLHSSQTGKQEHLLKDVEPELTPQAEPFSSTPDNSIRSSGSSSVVVVVSFCPGKDEKPLRQSKPCVVLSDSNIQLSGESTSSTLASRGSILSLQASENRGTVERAAQSQSSVTDLSALHLPLDTSGAEHLQHLSPAWSRQNSMEPLSLDVTRDNAVDASSSGLLSPELSSPRSRQETSHSAIAMLVPSVNNLLFSRERPHDDDTSSETDN